MHPECSLRLRSWSLALGSALALGSPAWGLDYVTIRVGEDQRPIAGRVEIEAQDGGVLLLAPDGALWPIKKEDIVSRRSDAKPFAPLTREELSRQLTAEFAGFRVHATQHYLICYNTSTAYARWVGGLFEGLHKAFYNYWSRRGVALHQPQFPLVAVVFDSQAAFQRHARQELGEAAQSIIGYYNLHTNRMTMYDLSGVEASAGGSDRTVSARIQQVLSQPGAERTVATLVHEATHQLAFNSGLQVRFADVPLWVSEGIAIYFETPNLESTKGWRNVGAINRFNLVNFRKYLPRRPPGSLPQLLCDDKRFRDPTAAADAYAEAWALSYFLLQTRGEAYVKYLKRLAEKPPLMDSNPEQRLADFKQCFGDDLSVLEQEFLRYFRSIP